MNNAPFILKKQSINILDESYIIALFANSPISDAENTLLKEDDEAAKQKLDGDD